MRPCRVCGNSQKGELNVHHFIPRGYRKKGTPQKTIKLCRDQLGCRTHIGFHQDDPVSIQKIVDVMDLDEALWILNKLGIEKAERLYPGIAVRILFDIQTGSSFG